MAKKRQRNNITKHAPRDPFVITSPAPISVPDLFRLRPHPTPPRSGRVLADIEDRRTFHPARVRPSRTPRQVARVLMALPSPAKKNARLSREIVSFKLPKSTAVCVRRSIRKEVIHAKGVAGGRVGRPHRNAMSRISCKRKK